MEAFQRGEMELEEKSVHDVVKEYYGKVLESSKDLKTSACCTSGAPHKIIRDALAMVPTEIKSRYYGCGSTIPFGIQGKTILDLGSGSGRDCYVASILAGAEGSVIGLDMTDEQLEVADRFKAEFSETLGYSNMTFLKGYIEMIPDAGIERESVDVAISNCVVNLSPDKEAVLQGVFDVLKEGGEFFFSDIYADRRLPEEVRKHPVLHGECIAGALYIEDFKRIARKVGFTDPRMLEITTVAVEDEELKMVVGNAKFYSITYRLFKIASLETLCEDYGQFATYLGTIEGHEHNYPLDDHHVFITGKPMAVCGNSGSMVAESWLGEHFELHGNRDVHFGLFDCSGDVPKDEGAASASCC